MKLNVLTRHVRFALFLLPALALGACNGESSSSGGGGAGSARSGGGEASGSIGSGGANLSAGERDARDFVRSTLAEHWLQTSEGWTTQFQLLNGFGQPIPGVPDLLFWQVKALEFGLVRDQISEADRLNGTDYRAQANFGQTPQRYFRTTDTGEGPKGWSMWNQSEQWSLTVEHRGGKWLVSNGRMLEGIKPAAPAVAAAK